MVSSALPRAPAREAGPPGGVGPPQRGRPQAASRPPELQAEIHRDAGPVGDEDAERDPQPDAPALARLRTSRGGLLRGERVPLGHYASHEEHGAAIDSWDD